MTYYEWVSLAILVGIIATVCLSWTDWFARRTLSNVADTGLPRMLEHAERALAKRLTARLRVGLILGGAAFAGAITVIWSTSSRLDAEAVWTSLTFLGCGYAVGMIIVATRQQLTLFDTPVRVARLRTARLGDYIPSSQRAFGWITTGCVVVASALQDSLILRDRVVTASEAQTIVSTCLIGGLALAGMLVFEIAGRRIAGQPQPSGSRDELMWDDAGRADTLRDILLVPLLFGAYGFLFSAVRGFSWDYGAASIVVFALFAFALVGLVLSRLTSRMAVPHYLDRLWSNSPRSDFPDSTLTPPVEAR